MKRKPVRTKTLSRDERIVREGKSLTSGETNSALPLEPGFQEVHALIERARERAYQAVNTGLIDLYWQVGEYISRKLKVAEWGDGVVAELAACIQRRHPNLRGFTRASLFRMRQFFEAYRHDSKVAALLRQLPWTHHLTILGRGKSPEEREFYLRMAIREQWPSRQLERQFDACLFERAILSPQKSRQCCDHLIPRPPIFSKTLMWWNSSNCRTGTWRTICIAVSWPN